jgi:S-adenosylmethionine hydrolase
MPFIITLTTDFGRDSAYVAAMKGVILSVNADATIVDISHEVGPQNITHAAFVLGEAARWFPADSLHVAVVDPGVGTGRRIVYACVAGQQYVCPDNGLLSYVCRDQPPEQAFEVTNRSLFLAEVSNTFHGRDIMAPVAAHLSLGFPPSELGAAAADLNLFDWPRAERRENTVVGQVLCTDSFGNLITSIRRADLPKDAELGSFRVEAAGHKFAGIVRTYADSTAGAAVALFGSGGLLELAVVQGNASVQLQISVGEGVHVLWGEQ